MTAREIVLDQFPYAEARQHIRLFTIDDPLPIIWGIYSPPTGRWLGHGPTEEAAWRAAVVRLGRRVQRSA